MTEFTDTVKHLASYCGENVPIQPLLMHHYGLKEVLELGTGCGGSAAHMMRALPEDGRLVTINLPRPPSGDFVGSLLEPWRGDARLLQILGDTRNSRNSVTGKFDLLFIDAEHTFEAVSEEWRLYESALHDVAVVCVDDLDFPGGGVRRFWDALPFEKVELWTDHTYGFGVFRYRRQP